MPNRKERVPSKIHANDESESFYDLAVKKLKTFWGWRDETGRVYGRLGKRKVQKRERKSNAGQVESSFQPDVYENEDSQAPVENDVALQAQDELNESPATVEKTEPVVKPKKKNGWIVLIFSFVSLIVVGSIAFIIYWTKVLLPESRYNAALDLYNAGNFDEALEAFEDLHGYKDSEQMKDKCFKLSKRFLSSLKAGDVYTIGTYEQDNKTNNGQEDIEWIVLNNDGDSLLMISKYVLDFQPYNMSKQDVTWEKCSLRSWLNGTFYYGAFSTDEQAIITNSLVKADANTYAGVDPGKDTRDKVFLLSIYEAYNYFDSDLSRVCKGTPYAYSLCSSYKNGDSFDWNLRSPGYDNERNMWIYPDGSIVTPGDFVDYFGGVRPALRIVYGSGNYYENEDYRVSSAELGQSEGDNDIREITGETRALPTPTPTPVAYVADPVDIGYLVTDITSSTIDDESYGFNYYPEQIMDDDLDTSWAEGEEDNGIGQYIVFSIPEGTLISGLIVHTGYCKSEGVFYNNSAPTVIDVYSGTVGYRINLNSAENGYSADNYDVAVQGVYVTFPVPIISNGELKITIVAARDGEKWSDTNISEIRILGAPGSD